MYEGDHSRKKSLVDYGFRLPSAFDNRPLKFPEFERCVRQVIYVSATPGPYELQKAGGVVVATNPLWIALASLALSAVIPSDRKPATFIARNSSGEAVAGVKFVVSSCTPSFRRVIASQVAIA